MRKNSFHGWILAGLLILMLCQSVVAVDPGETYFRFKTPDRPLLDKISRLISIDRVDPDHVYAYANNRELGRFEQLAISYEMLPHPGTLIQPVMTATKDMAVAWDSYPTYDTYVSTMNDFATNYPGLCTIVNAGSTVNGRAILFARISDNVTTEEDEPEVMLTSTMHGDETTGWILNLRLIDSLLTGYGIEPGITRLVDSLEIWINPLANPDGTYYTSDLTVAGARRYNANGVDLNRNFPDPAEGDHPDGYSWQSETAVMMALAEAHSFVISANHHGGAEVINYPWDTWSRAHSDEDWFVSVCLAWATSAHTNSPSGYLESTEFPDGITNGYAWYRVAGGRQDYMNYWHGCREITAELSNVKLLAASQLPAHWDYNKAALLTYLENALYGVRGIVTDASTSQPLLTTVRVLGHDADNSEVSTDPDVGDYHRMLSPGSYDLEFSAPGYYPDTVYAVTVSNGFSTRVDVALTSLSGTPVLAIAGHSADLLQAGGAYAMAITLVNHGDGNASDLTGLITGYDPYLTITDGNAAYPLIAGLGDSQASLTPYQFMVASDCPRNYTASYTLELSGADGFSQSLPLTLLVEPVVENFESASLNLFPWQATGPGWAISFTEASEGIFSSYSRPLSHGQTTELSLSLEVQASGTLYFDYKVSSESGYDYLRFAIDGVEQDAWSGELGWTRVAFPVETGSRTLTWTYEKDGAVSVGEDRAWVDRIIFPQLTSSLAITTTTLPDWTVSESYSVQLEQTGSLGTTIWSDKNNDLDGSGLSLSSDGLLTGNPTATGVLSFTAQLDDATGQPSERLFTFTINPQPEIASTLLPDAERFVPYEYQLTSTGGTSPLSWSDAYGDLDGTGITLTTDGRLDGTPTARDELNFTVELLDEAGARVTSPFVLFIDGGCCQGKVGDVNNSGDDDPTIGDVSALIDLLFISQEPIACYAEADINQSGGFTPTLDDLTIGDVSLLIDHLFISSTPPPDCL